MRRPNFFLIGAPKCGTTAMASWLRTHPQAFVTDPKEPLFFNSDFGWRLVDNLRDYESLFEGATAEHLVVGEASTFYLCSRAAVPSILAYSPDSRFLVMLRRPSEMVVSLHAQARRGYEEEDFATAWSLQSQRARGQALPMFSQHSELYQYGARCLVGEQLQQVLASVPPERILVLFLEDLKRNLESELVRVLKFLELPDLSPEHFTRENERTGIRSSVLKRALHVLSRMKRGVGISRTTGLLAPLYRLNTVRHESEKLSPSLQVELHDYFASDVQRVARLVGRVPPEWLAEPPRL